MARVQRTRMLWYYSAIIDWMLANPGGLLRDCAAHVNIKQATLSIIINSDMFKAALAQRKANFQQMHDVGLIEKTTRVAHASLDAILETLEKKRDKIPIQNLESLADSALSRLGYGTTPQGPTVNVNVGNTVNNNVVLPVSKADLDEARMALRQVQATASQRPLPPREGEAALLELKAEPSGSATESDVEEEASHAAISSIG